MINRFEPIDEFWKYDGVMWQVLQNGDLFDVDSMHVYCVNCFYELGDDLKCDECSQAHRMKHPVTDSASKSSKSLKASKRRDTYSVRAPQIGEKMAEVDLELNDDKFMNVKLEKRKNGEQVVITTSNKGKKRKHKYLLT